MTSPDLQKAANSTENVSASSSRVLNWAATVPTLIGFTGVQLLIDVLVKVTPSSLRNHWQLKLEQWSLAALKLAGTNFIYKGLENIPEKGPCLIVSNHQSLFDIPLIAVPTHKLGVRFIAKRELAKWIPATSVLLRRNGHYLIDRERGLEARRMVGRAGSNCCKSNTALVIFPEGTRARDGLPRPMKDGGILAFVESCPTAQILPVTVDGSWRITQHQLLPIPYGTHITVTFHPPFIATESDLFAKVEKTITEDLTR